MPPLWNPSHSRTDAGASQDPPVEQAPEVPVGPELPDDDPDDFPSCQGTPSNPDNDDEDLPEANIAQAILLMTHELHCCDILSLKAKAKEPNTFDGSDPWNLNNFILLCNLYFQTNAAYSENAAKVTFALSYLRGIALEYFELAILDSNEVPKWMDNWSAFIHTLCVQFHPIDPIADAEDGIDNLKIQDNQHIVKYNVKFNCLAICTGWGDSVLRHCYYSGLAEQIKDAMGQQGKPPTLEAMKELAHSIDSHHWEHLHKKSCAGRNKSDSNDKSDGKNNKSNDKNKKLTSGNNNSSNSNKNNNKNKPSKPASSSSNSASLSGKLSKDGKLTLQECQRCFNNNLCMFCGGVGHMAKDCNKASSSAAKAKARAAQVKEKESADSKKV